MSFVNEIIKKILFLLVAIPLLSFAGSGSETNGSGMTVVSLGSTVGGAAVFNVTEARAAAAPRYCLYDLYYVDISSPGGKGLFSILLTAQAAGKKIVRFDWNGGGTAAAPDICYVNFVMLQN